MAFQQLAVAERVRCVHEAQGEGNRRRKVQLKCRSLLYRFPIDATTGGWTAVPLSCFSFTFPQHPNGLESKGQASHGQLAAQKLAAVILRRGKAMQAFHAAWRRRRRVRVHVFHASSLLRSPVQSNHIHVLPFPIRFRLPFERDS